jgi:hypothetical protein
MPGPSFLSACVMMTVFGLIKLLSMLSQPANIRLLVFYLRLAITAIPTPPRQRERGLRIASESSRMLKFLFLCLPPRPLFLK